MRDDGSSPMGNAFIALNLIGRSPCFSKTIQKIRRISRFDVGVYIFGETGTGKELAARAIHYLSDRKEGPFIPLSCGGLNDDLIINELFGHAKGAYTGADTSQPGMIQLADKGTLFLDEIDSLSPKAQIALLRFLQEKEFKRIGSANIKKADIRIISAGNRDLEQCVRHGTFRRDLLYRLDILRVDLPPLRQREDDVLILAEYFIKKFTHEFQLQHIALNENIKNIIKSHSWPGNVRELKNYILKLCLLSEPPKLPIVTARANQTSQQTGAALLPTEQIDIREGFNNAKTKAVDQFERQYLSKLLAQVEGNISQAARIAKKERRSFTRLLEKHQFCRNDFLPTNS